MKTCVLDLDETLIHSNFKKITDAAYIYSYIEEDEKSRIEKKVCFIIIQLYVTLRPYLKEFLEDLRKRYEIIIYTAGDEDYANSILDYIESKFGMHFSYRLYENQCVNSCGSCMFKYLNWLEKGRDMNNIVIVDNTIRNYALSLKNGIPIKSFFGSKNDKELIYLANYLRELYTMENVTDKIKYDFSAYLSSNKKK